MRVFLSIYVLLLASGCETLDRMAPISASPLGVSVASSPDLDAVLETIELSREQFLGRASDSIRGKIYIQSAIMLSCLSASKLKEILISRQGGQIRFTIEALEQRLESIGSALGEANRMSISNSDEKLIRLRGIGEQYRSLQHLLRRSYLLEQDIRALPSRMLASYNQIQNLTQEALINDSSSPEKFAVDAFRAIDNGLPIFSDAPISFPSLRSEPANSEGRETNKNFAAAIINAEKELLGSVVLQLKMRSYIDEAQNRVDTRTSSSCEPKFGNDVLQIVPSADDFPLDFGDSFSIYVDTSGDIGANVVGAAGSTDVLISIDNEAKIVELEPINPELQRFQVIITDTELRRERLIRFNINRNSEPSVSVGSIGATERNSQLAPDTIRERIQKEGADVPLRRIDEGGAGYLRFLERYKNSNVFKEDIEFLRKSGLVVCQEIDEPRTCSTTPIGKRIVNMEFSGDVF